MSEAESELLARLEKIYARGARAPVDTAALAAQAELEPLGADTAFVAVRSDDGRSVEVARVTRTAQPVRLAFPITAPYPIAEVLRRGSALFVASNEELSCDHPGLVRVKPEDHACATVPLHSSQGELIGAINFGFDEPRPFDAQDRERIAAVAARCAAVLAESRQAPATERSSVEPS